jgi:hypothetical protein
MWSSKLSMPRLSRVLHPPGEVLKLVNREIAGSAPAEIDELRLPSGEVGGPGVTLELAEAGVEVGVDLGRVLVRVDAEVAEVAALPAEGDVEIDAEVRVGGTRRVQDLVDRVLVLRLPE